MDSFNKAQRDYDNMDPPDCYDYTCDNCDKGLDEGDVFFVKEDCYCSDCIEELDLADDVDQK